MKKYTWKRNKYSYRWQGKVNKAFRTVFKEEMPIELKRKLYDVVMIVLSKETDRVKMYVYKENKKLDLYQKRCICGEVFYPVNNKHIRCPKCQCNPYRVKKYQQYQDYLKTVNV